MKRILKVLSSCAICVALTTTLVAAEFSYGVKYNGGDEKFVFTGDAGVALEGQVVTLRVADAASDPVEATKYLKQTTTDENGEFMLEAELGSDFSGEIWATITVGGSAVTKYLYKSTADEIIAAINTINGGATLLSLSATNKLVLMLDEDLSDAKNVYASEVVQKEKPFATDSIADFRTAYELGVLLYGCDNDEMTLDVYNAAVEAGTLVIPVENGKQYNAQVVFDSYTDEEKAAIIATKVNNNTYKSNSEFFAAIYDAVIMKEFSKGGLNNDEKYAIVKANNDHLGIDSVPACEAWGTLFADFKTDVFGKSITDIETLTSAFRDVSGLDKYKNVGAGDDDGDDDGGYGGSGLGGGMPSRPIVSPELIPQPEADQSFFNDLAGYEWALESIHNLAKDGIINGKAEKTFAPGDSVTRAEFVKMLIGALKITSKEQGEAFADIPADHWAYEFVKVASATNVVNGLGNGYFGANQQITRQDMAVMCFRALEYLDGEMDAIASTSFADDASISDYAKSAVAALSEKGIINGKGNNIFDPQNVATRAEAAKVIYSLLGR